MADSVKKVYEMKVDFWDKKSDINGASAEDVMNKHYPWTKTQPALLVFMETPRGRRVQRVEQIDTMIQTLGLDPITATDEDVRQALYNDVNKEYLEQQAALAAAEEKEEAVDADSTPVE